jgi:hypothetical protein
MSASGLEGDSCTEEIRGNYSFESSVRLSCEGGTAMPRVLAVGIIYSAQGDS